MEIIDYLRQQNREQREQLDGKDKTIKALQKEILEVKQSIYEKLVEVRKIRHSNNLHKNIEMLDIVEDLADDLHYDIQEELKERLENQYKKELVDLPKSN